MTDSPSPRFRFETTLLSPAGSKKEQTRWSFLLLPKEVSEALPRRGRTTVSGTLNGQDFQDTLEPDGQLSHWLKIDEDLQNRAGITPGDSVAVEVRPVANEPEPPLPSDFQAALRASPQANNTWEATTTLARLDWIHWLDSAKQAKTRNKRIQDACNMLAEGKKRVCCFDPSGFYSKALKAPEARKHHKSSPD
ncbi:MAG: YdeI/OmpD-associated family protein [Verrucomicrobiota bacterium JB023]|nr:YdeI/OmpD-associated family protein [Verrucomicrobiota bacterium JB023]